MTKLSLTLITSYEDSVAGNQDETMPSLEPRTTNLRRESYNQVIQGKLAIIIVSQLYLTTCLYFFQFWSETQRFRLGSSNISIPSTHQSGIVQNRRWQTTFSSLPIVFMAARREGDGEVDLCDEKLDRHNIPKDLKALQKGLGAL
ncbi:transmembrane protein, putative [Medicago truncatula]|uniref:Transmembrane protein, putative n=1 Tax=Medicago truncatula TaxID=3880 RepID=A0A072U6M9_MEDTR|nr:transmembrane protein, putative [Medicago truncatula]